MDEAWKFFRDNAAWVVPIIVCLLGGLGWLVKRAINGSSTPSQSQVVSGNSTGVQAGRNVIKK